MEDNTLTARQHEVLEAVVDLIRNRKRRPTIRAISEYLGEANSATNVQQILVQLERKGYLHRGNVNIIVKLVDAGSSVEIQNLTDFQATVYEHLVRRKAESLSLRTVRSITDDLINSEQRHFLPGSVHKAVKALEKKGLIVLEGKLGGIDLSAPIKTDFYAVAVYTLPAETSEMTLLGNNLEILELPLDQFIPNFVKADADRFVGVRVGDKLKLWWFATDDLILFEKKRTCRQGDLVIFEYQGHISIGYYYRPSNRTAHVITDHRLSKQELSELEAPDRSSNVEQGNEFYGEPRIFGVAVTAIINNLGSHNWGGGDAFAGAEVET